MILEQKFLKSDLDELAQVFAKSMEPGIPIFRRGGRWNKIWKSLLLILSLLLLGCSLLLIILEHAFSTEIKIYVSVGILCILTAALWNFAEKKADPQNLVMRKYSSPFWVEIKEDALLYRHKEFLYMDIRAAAAYKNFLFIKADRRWLVIKADKDEKQAILSKISKKTLIRLTEEKEAFDLRKL